MSLNLKQGSSLLDDDEENSSSVGGLQHQQEPSSAAISGGVAEEEVSDHDTEEDSDEYYEEEDGDDDEEGNNDEEITERAPTEKEKEDDVGPFSNDTVNSSIQPVEDNYTKETDDTMSSSVVGSDSKMSMLSNFLKRSTTTKVTTQENTEEVTASSSRERVSDKTPVSPCMSNAGAATPPSPQSVLEESVFLQTSPPTEKRTSERKEEGAAIIREESHNVFSDDDYEFFSTYLNEGDDKIDFEHDSQESFYAPAIETTGAIYEQDADDELDDEDGGTEDVFKPTIPIEEQFLIQEERAARSEAIRSAASLARAFNDNNVAKSPFAGELANIGGGGGEEEKGPHKKPLSTTKVSSQLLTPQISPVPLPINVSSAAFPLQKYSFTYARKDLEEVDYEEEKEEEDEYSVVCNPSYSPGLKMSPSPFPPPPQVSPGLIAEAGAAASKLMSQAESNADKLKRMAFSIKVKMLREETKGLHCNKLVDILFGEDDDNLKMPSLEMRKKLKKAIDIELIIKRFMDYKAVVDINTAELFMKDKSALEDICRQQVMSNPLLSSLDYDHSIPNNNNKFKTKMSTSKSHLENESDSASVVSDKDAVATTTAAAATSVVETPQVVLYQELTDVLTNSSENTDPATRLTNKISFLKKMLAFKIGNMCNMSKMLNLSSFIVKQAINMIGGGAAAERVLLHGGNSGGPFYSGVMREDPSLSGAGIGLLFGTILGGVNSVIIRSCVSVARLAMTMGVPIVMLNWPQEFKTCKDYESILRESILKFKHTSSVSLSFILDSVFGVEEEQEEKETTSDTPAVAVSLLTDKEKAKIIRDSINNYSDRDFFGSLFEGYYGHNSDKRQRGETLEMPMELLYQNASNVIEHKNRITDNMLSGIVEYLEENKILLSKILNKLISKASLAATMYYINSSSVKKANNVKKNSNAQKASGKVNKRSGAPLKRLEGKGISSSIRTILADRRRVVGGGLSASRGRLRSMMPVIAAPQKITSTKSSRYRRDSDDSDFNTDSDINSHLITDYQKAAFRQWVKAQ